MPEKKKKQKEKVVYYDDGSTIADMSRVNRRGEKLPERPPAPRSFFREKWRTYWAAVRMMIIPMITVLLIISVLFFLLMLYSRCA